MIKVFYSLSQSNTKMLGLQNGKSQDVSLQVLRTSPRVDTNSSRTIKKNNNCGQFSLKESKKEKKKRKKGMKKERKDEKVGEENGKKKKEKKRKEQTTTIKVST